MEYLVPVVIVVLVVLGLVWFLVVRATSRSGADTTPLGDTEEHAGAQTEQGTTVQEPERERFRREDADAAAHVGRPGEGEGRERLEFEGERPSGEPNR
jgi:flagellar biosynthesis/type III secretory pathway M-ring protein FliF/YscJ